MRDKNQLNIKKPFTEKTVLKFYHTVKAVLFLSFPISKERSFDL
jgi:hypothetical protein